ncbi:hypothetical protein ACHAWU_007091 [Discostella pseudostelligera]|uniref:tRNA-5-taurinomethyluridine 2-sulfurtransferase n=1 Tax=Discostella pseudostelligera TaxID=259834 RepID=A0ABD3N1A1_9STRA
MSKRNPIRIVVAMSGGVDSSVAAHLLVQQQKRQQQQISASSLSRISAEMEVVGLHMSNWNALDEDSDKDDVHPSTICTSADSTTKMNTATSHRSYNSHHPSSSNNSGSSSSSTNYCEASEKEYHDASSVAKHLSIPLHRVSFASEYWIQVFEPFVESIIEDNDNNSDKDRGQMRMLNPDFGCNTHIKFGTMKDYAIDRLQAEYIATGHYARLWHRDYYATLLQEKGETHGGRHSAVNAHHNDNYADFYHWMEESSRFVGNSVMESLSGLPEEEWILHTDRSSTTTTSHCPMLIAGADTSKDQSYFLSGVRTESFRNVIFPLGHLIKSDVQNNTSNSTDNMSNDSNDHPRSVRELARTANIPTATKRDSMGICFIGQRNFGNFISQYLPEYMITTSSSVVSSASESSPRVFVDIDTGKILGHHRGMMHYTLGQGAKIPGVFVRYFVCGKGGGGGNSNTIYVCNSTHHPALYTDELYVDLDSFNWIGLGVDSGTSTPPRPLLEGHSVRLLARTRHLQPLASCTVSWKQNTICTSGSGTNGQLVVHFDNPIRAITPGQIVALYAGWDGLICLGGGVIGGKAPTFFDRGMSVSLSDLHPSGHNDLSLLKYC